MFRNQLFMITNLYNSTFIQHNNLISIANG